MTHEELQDLEKNALSWYSHQPMGSAVRQNGPAAIQAYMAGYTDAYKVFEAVELDSFIQREYEEKIKETRKQKKALEKYIKDTSAITTLPQ